MGLKRTKVSAPETFKSKKRMLINLFILLQPVNKLKISDHEESSSSVMSKNQIRQTYVATYSEADKSKFPIRESFGEEVAEAKASKAKTGY